MQESNRWLEWIIQSIALLGIGIIGFFIKQTLSQIKSEIARVEGFFKSGLSRVEERLEEDVSRVEKRVEEDVSRIERRVDALEAKHERLPYEFTTSETHLRTYSAVEKKLDKIYDMLSGLKRSE